MAEAETAHFPASIDQNITTTPTRPMEKFPPTLWGCSFASFSISDSEIESYTRRVEVLKEKVRDMLAASKGDFIQSMELINLLCRLGVSYHLESEIEEQLNQNFNSLPTLLNDNDYDLYSTALLFRVLRQYGYKVSSDMFRKFKDNDGEFSKNITSDIAGLLSLYEATFLRMHGEDILDEALTFTRLHLESLSMKSTPHLAQHIKNALTMPLHRGLPRIEARKFISFYEEEKSHNETLLKFAKLDFNRVQLLHKQELSNISRWWKDLNLAVQLPHARDRIVESYFTAAGVHFEPQFALSRIFLCKCIQILALVDDAYDSYGRLEDLQCFTSAFERCNYAAIDNLPADYLKIIYKAFLTWLDEMDTDKKSVGLSYVKEKYNEVMRAYHVEAIWFKDSYLPTFKEYSCIGLAASTVGLLTSVSFIGMGKLAGLKEYQWLQSNPKIVEASKVHGRFVNDLKAREGERKKEQYLADNSYMKEYGVSKEEAIEEIKKICENAWKDINEEFMRPFPVSMPHLMTNVNISRVMEVMYFNDDGFT